MKAAGLIFSNIHDQCIPELTGHRTMASVPFGGRYRFVDFTLSNMVNSDITTVGIITHNNYQSLFDHIGTGKDWDLARRSGGIRMLPPFVTSYNNPIANKLYTTRLEALIGVRNFIESCKEDYIVMSDCNMVCNIDFREAIAQHEKTGADITVIVKKLNTDDWKSGLNETVDIVEFNERKEITDYMEYDSQKGDLYINTNMVIVTRKYLLSVINDAVSRGYTSFASDIIARNKGKDKYYTYEYDGFFEFIDSMQKFFYCNMEMLKKENRKEVFSLSGSPIYTKVRNTPPTRYTEDANVKNSIIADGCVIEGTVENSVLFRGVKIGKGTVVKNSILLQDTYTGKNVYLNCVITDKNVTVKDDKMLSGHESLPFFIKKGTTV